jgi:SAM-dependent methyltransferase
MHPRLNKIVRRIYYKVPFRLRMGVGRVVFFPIDALARMRGGKPRPPSIHKLVGQGDFEAIGAATVSQLIEVGGLRPDHSFLDIGCGIGRIALPLASYLLPSTPYAGFDIVPEFIDWCRENISGRHPNFRFELVDIANSEYNRGGQFDAASFRFAYPDDTFAFAYAGSVFTHLLPPGASNYIRETARVLQPGGTLVATFFLLNDESERLIDSGQAHMPLRAAGDGFRMLDAGNPEADVGLDEAQIQDVFGAAGLEIQAIRYGSWCGRTDGFTYQDLVVARKMAAPNSAS